MNTFQHSMSNTMNTLQHYSINDTLNTSQHSTANIMISANITMNTFPRSITNNMLNASQHTTNTNTMLNTSQHTTTTNMLDTSQHTTVNTMYSSHNAANPFMADFSESLKAALKQVVKEDKKAMKKKAEKKDKKDKEKAEKNEKKKKDKKATERSCREDKLPKLQDGDSMTSLDFSHNGSSCSLDAGSDSWCQDYTRHESENVASDIAIAKQAEKLRMLRVEEQHTSKREERRRKREEAKEKSMSEVDVQDKRTAEEIEDALFDDRVEHAFLWYTRMAAPSRKEFKRQIATQAWIDISADDVDLLTWNETGTRVVDFGTGPCSYFGST